MSRAAILAKAVKSVVAGILVAATALALLSFVLYRIGLDAWAATLLSDHYTAALAVLSGLVALLFFRVFDR